MNESDYENKSAVQPGELSEEHTEVMDYMAEQSNTVTRDGNFERWRGNVLKNRPFFVQGNPDLKGLTSYVICAGPSLDKNVEELKTISERGIIVCVDAALRYLILRGVVPEYCMMIDGSEKMAKMIEGCDTSKTVLVCTPSTSPDAIAAWKGPRYFVTTPHLGVEKKFNAFHLTRVIKAKADIKAGDELYLDEQYEVEFGGVTATIGCGGNVSTAAHFFALNFLRAQQVVFVGLDLSWKYDNHHYAGWEHQDNYRDRTKTFPVGHKDLNGDDVNTNFSLMQFKRWHEATAKQMPGTVVNATEGGILGVGDGGVKVEFIEFLTLKEAIAKYTPRRSEEMEAIAEPMRESLEVVVNDR